MEEDPAEQTELFLAQIDIKAIAEAAVLAVRGIYADLPADLEVEPKVLEMAVDANERSLNRALDGRRLARRVLGSFAICMGALTLAAGVTSERSIEQAAVPAAAAASVIYASGELGIAMGGGHRRIRGLRKAQERLAVFQSKNIHATELPT
jgi:hypothetical protein